MSYNNYRMQFSVKCCYNCMFIVCSDRAASGDCSQMPKLQHTVCTAAICDKWIRRETMELPSDSADIMISASKIPLGGE